MAVELEIQDGSPWWMSTDIWTVPGTDPLGGQGVPIAGQPGYVWARVRNNGLSSVSNAEVRFYWANPSVGFDRNTANLVGTANVNLLSGEVAEVLCLTPWVPEFVNNGHECLLAEAFHSSLDPLPATPDFDVPTDRHVAQLNLSVAQAIQGFFAFPLGVYNTLRLDRQFEVRVRQGRLSELRPLQRQRKLDLPKTEGKLVRAGFTDMRCPTQDVLDKTDDDKLDLSIPGGASRFTTLVGRVEGGATLIHVEQFRDDRPVGGLSVVVLP